MAKEFIWRAGLTVAALLFAGTAPSTAAAAERPAIHQLRVYEIFESRAGRAALLPNAGFSNTGAIMKYTGSCHCGDVAFEFEGEFNEVIECNCSHCSRKGLLLTFVPREQFQLNSDETKLGTYMFNKHMIQHRFCNRCGCAPFAYGDHPKGGQMAAINVRCLDNFDLASVKRTHVDGKSF